MNITNYIKNKTTIFFSMLLLSVSFADPNWSGDFDASAYEFSATLTAAEVYIDGELKTTGQLAAFAGDEIRGLDSNGSSFFPPAGTNIWEVSLYSNQSAGTTVSFKYYDDATDTVIDLNETITFASGDIIADAFSPFNLTGTADSGGDGDGDGDCVTGNQNWGDSFDATAYEFSATLTAAEVYIDGELKTTGELAAFAGDEIRGLDSNGATFFPPGGTNIWEVSLYSNESAGTTVSFKYYDDVSNTVIDLNETITFASGDIIANAFSPFDLTGSSCGDAPCDDADADGVCDDVDDCVGDYDECGVCNGDGIADGACDCDGNVADCAGDCGGDAVVDECGVCNGDGIADGACDCDGNVTDCAGDCGGDAIVDDCGVCNGFNVDQDDCGVCNGGNADQDCAGECFGDAEIDDCGVCNGFNADQDDCGVCNGGNADQDDCGVCFGGNADQDDCGVCFGDNSSCSGCTDPTADNFDDTATIDDGTCVFASGPALFQFSQSTSQSFYFVFNANIQVAPGAGGQALAAEDWLGAFKDLDGDGTGDVCVGAKKWDPSQCGGGICDIALMGFDEFNPVETADYMQDGDIPVFMVYDASENIFYDAKTIAGGQNYYFDAIDFAFSSGGVQVVQEISVRYDCNNDLGGHAFTDYCENCVEGGTGLEENYADQGCGCDNNAPESYCLDTDTDELGNPGTDALYCLADDVIDCSANFNELWDFGDDSPNFCYENLPADWYSDCSDECINDVENDADEDGICGDVDGCPYDFENDADGDGICGDVDGCPYDSQNDADDDGICGDVDTCPYDDENDADDDGICGDVDTCPYDDENDIDGDGTCGDIDPCPYDAENDADGDDICGDVDECPYDFENDFDEDGICGDVDECPYDFENDADSDGICGDVDACPYDDENDADNDSICGDVDTCPYDNENDIDGDEICGDVDECPYDFYNDIDGDGFCADIDDCPYDDENDIDGDGDCNCTLEDPADCPYDGDSCPYDDENDADGDGICGDEDACPYDEENDIDGDSICGDEDECPYDFYNDADSDGQCGDVDPCPNDAEDDADEDGLCADVDTCPYDDENDIDGDGTCGDIDPCPYDAENDADGDDICGDVDECPYDFENDADSDGLCGDVDDCPYDDENDADGDEICGDVDFCPYDNENDADADGICGDVDICSYDPLNDADADGLCCSDQNGDGINDDVGFDYFGNEVVGGDACGCFYNYFDCSYDCVDADSDEADTIDNCDTCDDIDWNDCEDIVIELHDNANLISFFALPDELGVDSIFDSVSEDLLAVASEASAAIYDDGWTGGLTELSQTSGYWVVMSDAADLSILGTPIDPETSYSLESGANLIGYPLNSNLDFLSGISDVPDGSLTAVFGEGISALNYGGEWIGSLQYFTPNSGYWFLADEAIDFSYSQEGEVSRTVYNNYSDINKNPDNFEYYQSKKQSFYYVENVEDIKINDWVLAYNNDVLVGSRQYLGGIIDIPVMGDDNTDFTVGYCDNQDVPEFKLYRPSTGMLNDLSGDVVGWTNNSISVLDDLSLSNIPTEMSLSPAYPNPFNPSTNLSYTISQDGNINLSVYDINGRLVESLVDSYQEAGNYSSVWNASHISSGVYFVRLSSSSEILTQKVMLIK